MRIDSGFASIRKLSVICSYEGTFIAEEMKAHT